MDEKGWGDLDTRQWWFGVLLIAGSSLVAAISTGRENIAIIAAGVAVWAVGEWVQHPVQWSQSGGRPTNKYARKWSFFGVLLNVVGIALIGLGIIRLL